MIVTQWTNGRAESAMGTKLSRRIELDTEARFKPRIHGHHLFFEAWCVCMATLTSIAKGQEGFWYWETAGLMKAERENRQNWSRCQGCFSPASVLGIKAANRIQQPWEGGRNMQAFPHWFWKKGNRNTNAQSPPLSPFQGSWCENVLPSKVPPFGKLERLDSWGLERTTHFGFMKSALIRTNKVKNEARQPS